MPIVTVSMWSGRTKEQKEELAQAITNDMVKIIGLKPESIQVIFHDVLKSDWAVGGKISE